MKVKNVPLNMINIRRKNCATVPVNFLGINRKKSCDCMINMALETKKKNEIRRIETQYFPCLKCQIELIIMYPKCQCCFQQSSRPFLSIHHRLNFASKKSEKKVNKLNACFDRYLVFYFKKKSFKVKKHVSFCRTRRYPY